MTGSTLDLERQPPITCLSQYSAPPVTCTCVTFSCFELKACYPSPVDSRDTNGSYSVSVDTRNSEFSRNLD